MCQVSNTSIPTTEGTDTFVVYISDLLPDDVLFTVTVYVCTATKSYSRLLLEESNRDPLNTKAAAHVAVRPSVLVTVKC